MKKGFTLIELMVVVVVLGILLAIILPRVTKAMDKSREKTLHKNLKNIKVAIDTYCQAPDGGYDYPTTSEELKAILNERFDNQIPRAVLRTGANVRASNECYLASSTASIPAIVHGTQGGWVLITSGSDMGNVYINTTAKDTEGDFYTTYVCW